ncbi:MAG: GAF domain-containing protein [Chloroflexota bacterium]
MRRLSILLIENEIAIAATIVQAIGQHLPMYRFTIVRSIAEALAEQEPADVILINSDQLASEGEAGLPKLIAVYPESPIFLLHKLRESPNDILLAALKAGADDYAFLDEAGLLVLGRRLEPLARQTTTPAPEPEQFAEPAFSQFLDKVLDTENSQLALQIIGADNRVRAWNRAAETFFGLKKEYALGVLLEDLPLSPANLSRLKDILDQARLTGQAFSIANYPLEDGHQQPRWGKVYVYPLANQTAAGDVCIVSADVSDLKQLALDSQHYSQELQILLEISRAISEDLNLPSTLVKIAEQTKSLFNADNCYIFFLEKDNRTLRPVLAIGINAAHIEKTPLTVGDGIISAVAASGKAIVVNYAQTQALNLYGQQRDAPPPNEQHLLAAPLTALKGVIGLLVVTKNRQPPFAEDDFQFFRSLVQQASWAISNARLFEETQRNLAELAIFYEASAAISTTHQTQELLTTLIRQMVQGLGVSRGHIVNWDRNQNKGAVQALYLSDDRLPVGDVKFGAVFNLAARPAIAAMLDQKRPVFFQISHAWLDDAERADMRRHDCRTRLLVPLVVKGETIGWAELWEIGQERLFTADEIRLARLLANQAAVALDNARYLKQTQQTLDETIALYEVASALASTRDSQTIMSTVLEEFLRVLNLKQGSVIIFDFEAKQGVVKVHFQGEEAAVLAGPGQTTREYSYKSFEGQQIRLKDDPIFTQLMRTRQPVQIDEVHPLRLTAATLGWARPDALSLLVIPIQIQGEITGAIVAEATRQKHTFSRWDISLGQALADQLGIALQNVELYELEYQRRQQAETLREVSFIVGSSLKLNEVLERILDQLRRVVKYDSAAIHLIQGQQRRVIAGRGFPQPRRNIGLTFPVTLDPQEPGSQAIHNRQPLVIGNIPEVYHSFKEPPHDHIKSWMGIPLIARDKVIGLITIDNTQVNAYGENDVNLALAFANQVAIALENARLYELEVRQLERELEIAQSIQENLLPQVIPHVPGLDISGRILPAQQIGGDFFQFFLLGQDQFGVAVGDVSGKGIPAALYMAVAMTAIDAQVSDTVQPGEILTNLQRVLYHRLRGNRMNVGLQVATFKPPAPNGRMKDDDSGKALTLASAGMVAPIIATETGCRFVPVSGLPIGSPVSDLTYTEYQLVVPPFTALIFTSDGIVEARNENGEIFGFERLEKTINEIISSQQAETIAEHIIHTAQRFTGDAEQNDDMTVVVIIVKP